MWRYYKVTLHIPWGSWWYYPNWFFKKSVTPPDGSSDDSGDSKPTMNNTKDEITAYLTAHHIEFDPNAKKEDLVALIK